MRRLIVKSIVIMFVLLSIIGILSFTIMPQLETFFLYTLVFAAIAILLMMILMPDNQGKYKSSDKIIEKQHLAMIKAKKAKRTSKGKIEYSAIVILGDKTKSKIVLTKAQYDSIKEGDDIVCDHKHGKLWLSKILK